MGEFRPIEVHGNLVDSSTRCIHYYSEFDIVAIKFKCCGKFYPCYKCHEENETHEIVKWSATEFSEQSILCGNCKETISILEYFQVSECPKCRGKFNVNCELHYGIYFSMNSRE